MTASPQSPCIGLCQLDASRVCLGCGRHIDEVVEWGVADDERKREILDTARHRYAQLRPSRSIKEAGDDTTGSQ